MTGLELKLQRVAADVRTKELAAEMGVTDSRITYLESRRIVTAEAERRYLAALRMCITKSKKGPRSTEVA